MYRRILLVSAASVVAASAAVALLLRPLDSKVTLRGSMFVSDAGRSHGGFEYNAEWEVTVEAEQGLGTMRLGLKVGLGDALEKHEYRVEGLSIEPGRLSMSLEGQPIVLVWLESDEVWDHAYDKHYVASWGGDAPPEEVRGSISPSIFPGLGGHYYVELRLRVE
ncbi:MAG: hypothetical protein JTT11_10695 [Candidatus Brockarchaeota archaeon]|nr:hypothetical protein [Candidatus Brockarchaeota archaeon]